MNTATPETEASVFDQLKMELRGYEVARLDDNGRYAMVANFRPNEIGRTEAIKMARYLDNRNKARKMLETYHVRPVVSIDVTFASSGAEAPLVLEEDVTPGLVSTDELAESFGFPPGVPLGPDDSVENPHDNILMEPHRVVLPAPGEFQDTGFKVPTLGNPAVKIDVPYNYADKANEGSWNPE